MRKLLNLAKWSITLGRQPQVFLGAKWIQRLLERASGPKKRVWALRMLSLSPHYFINPGGPEYSGLSHDEYLEKAFRSCAESRVKIFDQILKPYVKSGDAVLDYGCGPGFLAAATAKHVRTIYACDISKGALACAEILNPAPNLRYVVADAEGLAEIADGSLDVVFSFALIQHLSDEVFDIVLENCRRKLKPGGKLILQIQLLGGKWRSESDWKDDASIQGRLKFKYGLHCFGRTEEAHREAVERHGFQGVEFRNIAEIVSDDFDDVCRQTLLTARKT